MFGLELTLFIDLKKKIVSISETSLLYSRVRNDRNQLTSGALGGASSGTANNANSGASSNLVSGATDGTSNSANRASGTSGPPTGSGPSTSGNSERDSFSRWRERQYYGPRRWYQSSRDESQWEKDNG